LDAGPVIEQGQTPIGSEETADQLEERLAAIGAKLVGGAIDAIESGRVEALPQDASLICKAPRLKKTDGAIDWSRSAAAIKNQIRAMQPWPKAYTFLHRAEKAPLRLIVGPVAIDDAVQPDAAAGTLIKASGDRLVVACGEGAVAILSVQPAGKRLLSAAEFLHGSRIHPGDRFGPG